MEEKSLVVKPQAKIHSEDLGVDGSVILKWILNNRMGGCGMDSSGSVYRPVNTANNHAVS
jgi:hypothetical protein